MKKSSVLLFSTLILLFTISLPGCSLILSRGSLGQYENTPIHIDPKKNELDLTASNVFRIQTSLKFKLGESTPTVSTIGLATSLDQFHLLTARHVVIIKSFQTVTPFGAIEFPISDDQKLEEETSIILDDGSRIRSQIVYSDGEKDFALLKAEKSIHHFPFTIGNSDDLRIGNFLFLLGNFQTGLNIRSGYITQLHVVRYGDRGEVSNINEDLFGISAVTVEGDSGAPIFLLRDGRFELGGIVVFLLPQARGLGFGVKINSIMKQIDKYLKENANSSRQLEEQSGLYGF
jgi:S1-C subfamily serine protease